jgi:signal transduction histidine kinase
MTPVGIGNPYERELHYYRNECNDLGARLLRLQEEQSQAFLEARRSRTVARLVREAYRFAEPAQAMQDVGGTLLQVVVEAALCDRAALLREEPPGSGRFLVAHAIGGTSIEADEVVMIPNPPGFFFTSSLRLDRPPEGLLDVLRLPFILWAYDRSSGHALVIGNRSEGNVSRPFESGDQELIETALFVYLDVLYRKHAEAQLRQAKQSAEEANVIQARFLETLSHRLRPTVERIVTLMEAMASHTGPAAGAEQIATATQQLTESSHELAALANDALDLATTRDQFLHLDVQWIDLGDAMRRVLRACYPLSVKGGVELSVSLPKRSVSVCVDRGSMHRAIQALIGASLARALPGSAVKLSAGRRGDGAVEILVGCSAEGAPPPAAPAAEDSGQPAQPRFEPDADRVAVARRIVEAHDGVLLTETRLSGGSQARIILPVHMTRDDAGFN